MTQVGVILLISAIAVASMIRPAAAFGLVIVLLPTEQLLQSGFPVFAGVPWLGNVALASIPALAAIVLVARGQFSFRAYLHPVLVATVLLYGWLSLTALWAPEPIIAFDSLRIGVPYALVYLILAPALVQTLDDVRVAMRSVLLYGFGVAALIALDPNFELSAARLAVSLDSVERTNPLEIGSLGGRLLLLSALGGVLVAGWWALPLRAAALLAGAAIGILSGSRGQVLFAIILAISLYPVSRRIANFNTFIVTAIGLVVLGFALIFGSMLFVGADNEERWSSESLLYGGVGRFENAADLLAAYLNSPGSWIHGLGFLAFGSLPTSSGDAYSHVATVDALAEAGLIGFALFAGIIVAGFLTWLKLFRAVRDDPTDRAVATILLGLFLYAFLLANKQGTVWSAYGTFVMAIVIARCTTAHFQALGAEDESDPAAGTSESEPGPAPLSEARPQAVAP